MSFTTALQKYIENPIQPEVVYYDNDVVIIKDKFPKLIRHYLVLPRDAALSKCHPLEAFQNRPDQYQKYAEYVEKAKDLIVESLVAEKLVESDAKPRQIFRKSFIRAGVHSIPSMANLHIHVITQDFYLARMKNKKHYNSFTTRFFVDYADLEPQLTNAGRPDFLTQMDDSSGSSGPEYDLDEGILVSRLSIRKKGRFIRDQNVLKQIIRETPLTCVYCHRQFGNSFVKLKEHLEREYVAKFMGAGSETDSSG